MATIISTFVIATNDIKKKIKFLIIIIIYSNKCIDLIYIIIHNGDTYIYINLVVLLLCLIILMWRLTSYSRYNYFKV